MKSTGNENAELRSDAERFDLTHEKNGMGMAWGKEPKKFPKSDFRHWEGRVFKNTFRDAGGVTQHAKTYSVRIGHRGRREFFPLGLAGQRASAKRARDIYLSILSEGWEGAVARYRPEAPAAAVEPLEAAPSVATVGELITAACALSDAREKSLWGYGAALRRIVAGIVGATGKRKTGPKKGGAAVWRAKLDAGSLDVLTDAAVRAWMLERERAAGADPVARRRVRNTANSTLRMARGLFAKKHLALLREALAGKNRLLPEPLPFANVTAFPRQSMRYQSKIDPAILIEKARVELGADPAREGEWLAFLLAFAAGLRKMEIDRLLWSQIDLTRGVVRIEATAHFTAKSEDSLASVPLDAEVVELLRKHKLAATGPFVLPGREPRPDGGYGQLYRADAVFERLNAWLREQGVDDRKPLHTLRKEVGAVIASRAGLFDAQVFLRHASPATTAAHYADQKNRVSAGLGSFFAPPAPAPRKRARAKKS